MSIIAVIAQPPKQIEGLKAVIAAAYPNDFLDVGEGIWLIAANATPQEVSDRLEITKGLSGSAIVLAINGYYGRANPNIWNWMKTKWEATGNGE